MSQQIQIKTKTNLKIPKTGPNLFEMQYLKQLHDEIEVFLKSKNFNTIEKISIGIQGDHYQALIRVG